MALPPLERRIDEGGYHYRWVDVAFDARRTHRNPDRGRTRQRRHPRRSGGIAAAGAEWWPLAMARELDDAILMLRANELAIGTLLLKTSGAIEGVLACDAAMAAHRDHWLVRETIGLLRRTLQRLDVTSRSLFAIIDEGSCFAGTPVRTGARRRPHLHAGATRAAGRPRRAQFRGLEW